MKPSPQDFIARTPLTPGENADEHIRAVLASSRHQKRDSTTSCCRTTALDWPSMSLWAWCTNWRITGHHPLKWSSGYRQSSTKPLGEVARNPRRELTLLREEKL